MATEVCFNKIRTERRPFPSIGTLPAFTSYCLGNEGIVLDTINSHRCLKVNRSKNSVATEVEAQCLWVVPLILDAQRADRYLGGILAGDETDSRVIW